MVQSSSHRCEEGEEGEEGVGDDDKEVGQNRVGLGCECAEEGKSVFWGPIDDVVVVVVDVDERREEEEMEEEDED